MIFSSKKCLEDITKGVTEVWLLDILSSLYILKFDGYKVITKYIKDSKDCKSRLVKEDRIYKDDKGKRFYMYIKDSRTGQKIIIKKEWVDSIVEFRKLKEYALYKGDEFLAIGTLEEISKQMNISIKALWHYRAPSYLAKLKNKRTRFCRILIEV